MWRQVQLPDGPFFEVELKQEGDRFVARAFGPLRDATRPTECAAEAAGPTFDAAEAALRKILYKRFR